MAQGVNIQIKLLALSTVSWFVYFATYTSKISLYNHIQSIKLSLGMRIGSKLVMYAGYSYSWLSGGFSPVEVATDAESFNKHCTTIILIKQITCL